MTPSMLAALASKAGLPRFIKDALGNFRGLFMGGKSVALPYVLAQSAVPVILAPNGTVAANGAITLTTPLPVVYAGAWVRLPAGAIVGGAAGLYWTTFSSTTVGAVKTLFVDPVLPFVPYVPSVLLIAAVGSGAAYTQTTGAAITLANVTLPGGAMGPNGAVRESSQFTFGGAAATGTRTAKLRIGGAIIRSTGVATTAQVASAFSRITRNRGVMSRQVCHDPYGGDFGNSYGGSMAFAPAIDTAVDQSITQDGTLSVPTDYLILDGFTLEVLPS